MATAAASSDAPAVRQMSWADRAKASMNRPPDLSKSTSPAPSNGSNATSSASNALSDSVRSASSGLQNGSNSAFHKRSGSDFATTAPVAPPPVETPPGSAEEVIVPSPVKAPPVNVWKERMAAAASQKAPTPAAVTAPAQPVMLPIEQRSPVMTNGKVAARGRPVATPQVPPPALSDTTNWPSPLDVEKGKAAEEAALKVRAMDTSPSATSSRSSGGQEQGKARKPKWVPIEADITIDAPLPTRYLKDGERTRPRSQSRDTSRSSQNAHHGPPPPRFESQPLSAGVPAFPMPAPAAMPSLPTSLPAKPQSMSMAMSPDGSYIMRQASPRMSNGIPPSSPPESLLRSPSSPTAPLSRSMSGSSAGRASSVAGSSSGRIESNRSDLFGQPSRGAAAPPFMANGRGRANGRPEVPRGNTSPRGSQGAFGRGSRGGFRGGRGGNYSNGPHAMSPPMPYYDGTFMPYGYMPQMPYMPQGMQNQPGQQAIPGQQPFNMMPMMQALPPAPFKTDYNPPLDAHRFYLLGQIEFYLSPDNLAKDLFLRQQMDTEGWIDMRTVLTFKRIIALTDSLELLRSTIALSPLMEVDYERYKFRTKNEWARWIMPDAKPAEPPTTTTNGISLQRRDSDDQDADDGSKSAEHSASEDGNTTGTTGATSPTLSQVDDMPVKAEAA